MVAARREKRRLRIIANPPAQPLSVLLVDSDPAEASAALRWLKERQGNEVLLRHAADSAAATRLAGTQDWDLLAIDLALPGAFEAHKAATASDRWMATLVVTASRETGFLQDAVRARIDGLLFKPVATGAFVQEAIDLAGRARRRRLKQQKRVLAIGAHPDDVEIGCGGALARHRAEGDALMILTLSRGANGGDTNVRTREAHRAADLLGAGLEFGELPDAHIGEGFETIEVIQAAIRSFAPTHVYTHSGQDTHQDHRNVHAATLVAAREVRNVFCYQSPSATVDFRPTFFVDIADHIAVKLEAIAVYRSQIERRATLNGEAIEAAARYWGRFAGYVLAEPMIVVRQRDSW